MQFNLEYIILIIQTILTITKRESKIMSNLKSQIPSLNKLSTQLSKLHDPTKKNFELPLDEDVYKIKLDASDNGEVIIRFLPPITGESEPIIRLYKHAFTNPRSKRFFNEKCPTSIDQPSFVFDRAAELWETGLKEHRDLVKKHFSRKTWYYANIFIIQDFQNPENNGTVRLYRFGTKIMEKVFAKINDTDNPVNIFDPYEGCNFHIKAYKKDGWYNYDKSWFRNPTRLAETDEEIENIWKQCKSLQELLNPATFLSYEELRKKYVWVTDDTTPVKPNNEPTTDYGTQHNEPDAKLNEASAPQFESVDGQSEKVADANVGAVANGHDNSTASLFKDNT